MIFFCPLAPLGPPPQVSGTTFVSRYPQSLKHGRHSVTLVKYQEPKDKHSFPLPPLHVQG